MKTLRILLLLILATSIAHAVDFDVSITPETSIISLNQSAEYNITVRHNAKITQFFDIYSPEVSWDVMTQPITDRNLRVEPGSAKRTTVRVRPLYVGPGYYAVPLNIKLTGTDQLTRKNVMVGVLRPGQAVYEAAIRTELVMDPDIDPREPVAVKLKLTNQNKRSLPNVDIKLRSELINYDQTTSLEPLEAKELTFDIRLDPATPEQDDLLQVSVFTQDRNRTVRFDVPSFKYSIQKYGSIESTSTPITAWLTRGRNITYTNTGNVPQTKLVHVPISWFDRFFVDASTDATLRKKDDAYEVFWKLLIAPQESVEVSYTINYHPLQTLAIVLVIIFILHYFLRSPIVVRKTAMVVESREGGVSELKIMLRVKNRAHYPLYDMVVLDLVPPIAGVQKEFEVGSLRPLKIFEQPGRGSQLKWVMDGLDPHDERILSYKIRTKFSVLGSFRLPPAKVRYRWFGVRRAQLSNVENLFR